MYFAKFTLRGSEFNSVVRGTEVNATRTRLSNCTRPFNLCRGFASLILKPPDEMGHHDLGSLGDVS